MDLKQFVSETLCQILEGINDAKVKASEMGNGSDVSPRIEISGNNFMNSGMQRTATAEVVHIVKFDVALTVSEGTGTKGGIGIVSGIVNIGTSGQSRNENSSVSRVQFDVPIMLPK